MGFQSNIFVSILSIFSIFDQVYGAPTLFSFIDRMWVNFISPRNADIFEAGHTIPIQIEIGTESRLLQLQNGTYLSVPVSVDRVEYTLVVPVGGVVLGTEEHHKMNDLMESFCQETDLHSSNCNAVRDKIMETLGQYHSASVSEMNSEPVVCISLDHGQEDCEVFSLFASIPRAARDLAPGLHLLEVRIKGGKGDVIVPYAISRFEVRPKCKWQLSIESPVHGSRVPSDLLEVVFRLKPLIEGRSVTFDMETETLDVCFSSNGWTLGCFLVSLAALSESQPSNITDEGFLFNAKLENLAVGRTELQIWLPSNSKDQQVCNGTSSFEVIQRGSWQHRAADDLVVVTAISENYFEDGRIQNLIGSIHYWEPGMTIVFYELGLSDKVLQEIGKWEGVEICSLPENSLPAHMYTAASYAFKPWAVNDALKSYRNVVWIDANVELRRPLDEMRDILYMQGYFFMTHPTPFPTPQFHHPETNRQLGCFVPDRSRQHCATTIMAFTNDSWAHNELLVPMLGCALQNECINPTGSSRANHRQEQSVLNAIMCRLNIQICSMDDKWSMQSFQQENYAYNITFDETDWNDVVLYTRRSHPIKPYSRFIKLKKPMIPS